MGLLDKIQRDAKSEDAKGAKKYLSDDERERIKKVAAKAASRQKSASRSRSGGLVSGLKEIGGELRELGLFSGESEDVGQSASLDLLGGGDDLTSELDEEGQRIYQRELGKQMAREKRRRLKEKAKRRARGEEPQGDGLDLLGSGGSGSVPDAGGLLLGDFDGDVEGEPGKSIAEKARELI